LTFDKRESYRKWYQEHREQRREYLRKWYQEHREQELENRRKYYQEYREQILEQQKKYNREHRKQHREYAQKWRQEYREQYREYVQKWYQEHREQRREYKRKYHQTRGYIYRRFSVWKQMGIKINSWEEYRALYLRARGKCEICNKELRMTKLEKSSKPVACLDHDYITGLPRGILCKACNTFVGIFEDRANKYRTYIEKKRRENENESALPLLWT
jgi:hypothetical protein